DKQWQRCRDTVNTRKRIVSELVGDQDGQQRGGEGNPAPECLRLFKEKIDRSTDRSIIRLIGTGPQCRKDRRRKETDRQDPFREGTLPVFIAWSERTEFFRLIHHNGQLYAADWLVLAPLVEMHRISCQTFSASR